MKNELTIIESLKKTIVENIEKYIPENLSTRLEINDDNVLIDFPDVDKMPRTTVFYIQPNWSDYEALSTNSDYSTFDISVFILCKKDTQSNLTIKVYELFNALYGVLKTETSLEGVADFTEITNADFYPAVEGNANVKGIEVSVAVHYTKDY